MGVDAYKNQHVDGRSLQNHRELFGFTLCYGVTHIKLLNQAEYANQYVYLHPSIHHIPPWDCSHQINSLHSRNQQINLRRTSILFGCV